MQNPDVCKKLHKFIFKMQKYFTVILLMLLACKSHSPQITLPLEKNNFQKPTSYDELSSLVEKMDKESDILDVEVIGQSLQNRNIYAMKFSAGRFGKDKSRIRVIFFAQQHGNEQSGKEGALMLAVELLKPENRYLFDKIDFVLIPQMNPDGSELNSRRNGNDIDLNRNHLILTEPEILALHRFFDKYMFEVNLDVHEYDPYGETWEKYGYRKNFDITLGVATNNNISKDIRDISNDKIVPYVLKQLKDNGFSSFIYCPGGPPEINYIRHSTFDINDGRQSFGIQSTFSFIQEGMNGRDNYAENLKHRASGQMTGMLAILKYAFDHKDEIKKIVSLEREKLINGNADNNISIQAEHSATGEKLSIPLYSYFSKTDSVVIVHDYRPVVKSITNVTRPYGYLFPKNNQALNNWIKRHQFIVGEYKPSNEHHIEQYFINRLDSIDFEGDTVIDPSLEVSIFNGTIKPSDYNFIPAGQVKSNLIVLALEPKSMIGLSTYTEFSDLVKVSGYFPVLRVTK